MTVRLPAVEDVLGTRLDLLSADHIRDSISRQVPEMPDLDFKKVSYSNLEEFTKDVVAMANGNGGLIILGIEEDANGNAARENLLDMSDKEEGRLLQSLRQRSVPFVPNVTVRQVVAEKANGDQMAKGFYLISVGRSLLAPHGVMSVGDEKRKTYWPVRDGTTTRFLYESELADFYRRRFAGEAEQRLALEEAFKEGSSRLNPGFLWLTMAGVPSIPGRLPSGSAGFEAATGIFNLWADQAWEESATIQQFRSYSTRFIPGVRRTIASDNERYSGMSTYAHAELYSSGAVFVAIALTRIDNDPIKVKQEDVEMEILTELSLIGAHAKAARASGEMLIRAGINTGKRVRYVMEYSTKIDAGVISQPLPLTLEGSLLTEPISVDAEEIASVLGCARVSYQIALDLVTAFAAPDCRVLTQEGQVTGSTSEIKPEFFTWATQSGLTSSTAIS